MRNFDAYMLLEIIISLNSIYQVGFRMNITGKWYPWNAYSNMFEFFRSYLGPQWCHGKDITYPFIYNYIVVIIFVTRGGI